MPIQKILYIPIRRQVFTGGGKTVEISPIPFLFKGIYKNVDFRTYRGMMKTLSPTCKLDVDLLLFRKYSLIHRKCFYTGLIKMAHESVLCVRVTGEVEKALKQRYPDAKMRANALRALVQQFVLGKLPGINSYTYKETINITAPVSQTSS